MMKRVTAITYKRCTEEELMQSLSLLFAYHPIHLAQACLPSCFLCRFTAMGSFNQILWLAYDFLALPLTAGRTQRGDKPF